jgi:hypothetical protein
VGDRTFTITKTLTAPALDGLRNLLPPGLTPIPRDPTDEPVIAERWL